MSEIFHKSCYTSRCTGYKYRTLSTNTGDKKHRDSKEDSTFDGIFRDLKREICERIDSEIEKTQLARESIRKKIENIESKVNSMLEMKSTVFALTKDLRLAENSLADITSKVNNLESLDLKQSVSEVSSTRTKRSYLRSQLTIYEAPEVQI